VLDRQTKTEAFAAYESDNDNTRNRTKKYKEPADIAEGHECPDSPMKAGLSP